LRCPEKFSQPGFKEGFEDMRARGKEILRGYITLVTESDEMYSRWSTNFPYISVKT
jgi:hypothetical protein